MGIALTPDHSPDFPAGSMFWARSAALKPLFDTDLITNFLSEREPHDDTLAHAIEHLYYFICEHAGYTWIRVCRSALPDYAAASTSVDEPAALNRFVAKKTALWSSKTAP